MVPAPSFHILTRVMQDRRLANGAGLYATGANFQEADTRTIVLPRRGPHEPGRTARLTLRFGTGNCSPWEVAGLGSGLGLGTKCN